MANGVSIGPREGEFIKSVDIQSVPDIHWLQLTPDLDEAQTWPDVEAAMRTYKEILKNDPVRADGRPNRPLTAFTVLIEKIQFE
jgi:hypothetical protein